MFAAAVMSLSVAVAQQYEGVKFEEGKFKEILAKGGEQGRYIFVDVYATWCGPCKYMTNVVFPKKAAGDYFNSTFVNAKFDAEKGEGVSVASRYGVKAYPTFLILDSKGRELARFTGGGNVDSFIKRVKDTMSELAPAKK